MSSKFHYNVQICSFCIALFLVPFLSHALTEGNYTYTVSNNVATITGFPTSYSGALSIPNTLGGYTVTRIGDGAFYRCSKLTDVTIPSNVTSIGNMAFMECSSLTGMNIPDGVTDIGALAFWWCTNLPNITLPNSITNMGQGALSRCTLLSNVTLPNRIKILAFDLFFGCTGLNTVTIPAGATTISNRAFYECTSLTTLTIPSPDDTFIYDYAFYNCKKLTNVYFKGNAPYINNGSYLFYSAPATVYYRSGTIGWESTLAGRPTSQVKLPYPVMLEGKHFGVQTNGFGFTISWVTNKSFVVEARTNLSNTAWLPLSTNTLTDGWSAFRDPVWTNHPARFYRIIWQ